MSTELATTNGTTALAAPAVTAQQLDLIRRTVAKDATPDELQLYLYDCQRQGVHPLDKLLHFTKRQGKYTPVTSIDLMRTRAAETGDHAGTDDPIYSGSPMSDEFTATVFVYRIVQGQRCAWSATARWSEYKPMSGASGNGDVMWRKMPYLMLGKCAEALALRKAFPRQLAGVYTREEMDQADAPAPPPIVVRKPAANPTTGEVITNAPEAAAAGDRACPDCGKPMRRSKFPSKVDGQFGYYCGKPPYGCGRSWALAELQPADDAPPPEYSVEDEFDQIA